MSLTARIQPPLGPPVPVRRWAPGLVGLGAIWGSSFLFIKVGVSELPPLYVALGRVFFGAVVLVGLLLLSGNRLPRDWRIWAHNAVVAVVGIAAPFALFAYGEQRIPSLLAGIWNSVTPLVALPMAVFVFRTERMTVRRGVGLALGLVGALVILGAWRGVDGGSLAGQLMCLAAAACYGISIPYLRRFVAPLPYSGVSMSVSQLLIATAVLAVAAPLFNGPPPAPSGLSWWVIASVVALGAGGTGLAFVIHLHNIRLVGATTASMVTYIIPIFATGVGVLVLGERLHWFQPVGAAIVLLGVAVSQGVIARREAGKNVPVSAERPA